MYINVKKASILAIVVVAVVGVFYFFYLYQKSSNKNNFNLYTQAYSTYSAQGGNSVQELKKAVDAAQKNGTPDDIASAKILLATASFVRNEGDDRKQGSDILKEIAVDQNLLPATRASAYSYMANWLYTYKDQELMKEFVFNTSPYSEYLKMKDDDVIEAGVYLLALANNLQANAFNNYEAAGLLMYKLRILGIDPSNKVQKEVAQRAQAYVVAGDDLFKDTQRSEFYKNNPGTTLFLLTTKAISLATLQPYFPDSIPSTKVMDAFEAALGAIAAAQNSLPAKFTASNARLEYAIWLTQAKNVADLDAKIRAVMKPIGAGQSEVFDSYMQSVHSRSAKSYVWQGAIRVAAVSADFKAYLKTQGWQDADFASK